MVLEGCDFGTACQSIYSPRVCTDSDHLDAGNAGCCSSEGRGNLAARTDSLARCNVRPGNWIASCSIGCIQAVPRSLAVVAVVVPMALDRT